MAFGWDDLLAPIASIINKVIPDKAAAAAAVAQLELLKATGQLQVEMTQLTSVTSAQSSINQAEATNSSVFVAGWRPFIGWICGAALAYQYIIKPVVLAGFSIAHQVIPVMPGIDDQLWQLMFGLLGMGALRSFDKMKGSATQALK